MVTDNLVKRLPVQGEILVDKDSNTYLVLDYKNLDKIVCLKVDTDNIELSLSNVIEFDISVYKIVRGRPTGIVKGQKG